MKNLLDRNRVPHVMQKPVGDKGNGREHIVDIIAHNLTTAHSLISCKHQHVRGSSDEKLLREAYTMARAVRDHPDSWGPTGFIILDGPAWDAEYQFMTDPETLQDFPVIAKHVKIFRTLEEFACEFGLQ